MDRNVTEETTPSTKEPILLKGLLWIVTGICMMAGALATYWIVHIYFDYYGGKSVTFYIAGLFVGYYAAAPLWWLYRKKYPKPDKTG